MSRAASAKVASGLPRFGTNWQSRCCGARMGEETGGNQGGSHETCSFLRADNYWIMSHSKHALGADDKELIEAERWDLEPKRASLCASTHAKNDKEKMMMKTNRGRTSSPWR